MEKQKPNYSDLFETAKQCLELSQSLSLKFQQGTGFQQMKSDKSWVTEADQAIESQMRALILKRHPNHFILGEEEGGELHTQPDDFTWILDPIDGTFSFVHGVPFYSSLVAVLHGGVPVVGFASLPAMGIVMSAAKGMGAFLNGVPYQRPQLVGNPCVELVATSDIYRFYLEKKEHIIHSLYNQPNLFKARTYGDALGYYLLLQGSVRAFLDPKVEIWDVAPFHVILPEAGFAIHHWDGQKGLRSGNSIAYALNDKGHPLACQDVLSLLQS